VALEAGSRRRGARGVARALTLGLCLLLPRGAAALAIAFDFSFDSSGFFADPERRRVLERAGQLVGGALADELAALVSGPGQTWTARFTDPGSGAGAALANPILGADTLLVFVGARDLGEATLATSSPGTASATGDGAWFEAVRYRGQLGAAGPDPTDFGPWGGWISFDADRDWHFGSGEPGSDQFDFLSASLHELLHVLGFGLAPSFEERVLLGSFYGSHAIATLGGPVPLTADLEHWAEGVSSLAPDGLREALMDPTLARGERRLPTALDWAGLADVGWTVVPEVGSGLASLSGLLGLAVWRAAARSRRARQGRLLLLR
jgi:hypothetical protein